MPLLLLLAGCREPEAAPRDLDTLLHTLWTRYDDGTDEELLGALEELEPLVAEDLSGTVTDLTTAEADVVERGDEDPSEARGMFIARSVDCALSPLEGILYELDQEGVYEAALDDEVYDRYDRAYTSELDPYVARTAPQLTWEVTYVPTSSLASYTAEIQGGLRWVPEADGVGPLLLSRTWMPEPAAFDEETDDYFEQDYQVEAYWTRGAATAHVYGLWRDLGYFGLTIDDDGVFNTMSDGLSDWDDDTATVCAGR